MADFTPIPEPQQPVYPEAIKMIMPGEPASGGYGSPENTQAEQLAQRTQWLKHRIYLLQQAIPGTEEFEALLEEIRRELDRLSQITVGAVQYQVDHLERMVADIMLQLEIKGIYPDSDGNITEAFAPPYKIDLTKARALSAVKNDDSIDVDSVSEIIIGANYIITDGVIQEDIRIANIITSGDISRVIATHPLTQEYDLTKTYIYRSTCEIRDGKAIIGGQSKQSEWEPGAIWKGEQIPGGTVSDSINFGKDEKAGFNVTPGIAFTSGAVRLANIIGVVDTGARNADGAGLDWIDENFNVIPSLDPAYFNAHASYNFQSVLVGTNHFRSIPAAYWRRGVVPAGKQNAGRWYMLLSDVPADGFSVNPVAYKKGSAVYDKFLCATYRAFNDGGKPGSQSGKTDWGGVSWQTFRDQSLALGDGHHMLTLQEYHEILARATIEKKTFQLWPENVRGAKGATDYRGIADMAYSGSVYAEWREGIRTNSAGRFEVWSDASGNFVDTGVSPVSGNYIHSLQPGGAFDFMFVAASVGGPASAMIPDYTYASAGYICYVHFYSGSANSGAFNSYWNDSPSNSSSAIGGRLAKL